MSDLLQERIELLEAELAELVEAEVKHGSHDQRSHGRRGGKGGGGGGGGSAQRRAMEDKLTGGAQAPGTKPTFAKGTPGAKYEERRSELIATTDKIKTALDDFTKQQATEKRNWGYAGSLAGMANHLQQVAKVPEPPQAKDADTQFHNRRKQVEAQLKKLRATPAASKNTKWPEAGSLGNVLNVAKEASTYLIDEDN